MSQNLSIELVQPGMRLVQDVKDADGKVVATRGEAVGEALLTLLRQRGIKVLPVELGAAAHLATDARQRLEYLFRRCAHESSSQALLRAMVEYRQERAA